MTRKTHKGPPPSQFMLDAYMGGGSHNMTCGFCGREHYCPDSNAVASNEDDEDYPYYKEYLTQALEEQQKDPDGTIIHYDTDYVLAKDINGMAIVVDCPCNGIALYEQFLWADRNPIRRYLKLRIDQEEKWASEEKSLNKLAGIT